MLEYPDVSEHCAGLGLLNFASSMSTDESQGRENGPEAFEELWDFGIEGGLRDITCVTFIMQGTFPNV